MRERFKIHDYLRDSHGPIPLDLYSLAHAKASIPALTTPGNGKENSVPSLRLLGVYLFDL